MIVIERSMYDFFAICKQLGDYSSITLSTFLKTKNFR